MEHNFAYSRRDPSAHIFYQTISSHLSPYLFQRMTEDQRPLPDYITTEFTKYLKCGILNHGFLRVLCGSCHHEHLVAFSCKGKGFCPSCLNKRKVMTTGKLIDEILPFIKFRQYVLSLPMALRFWLSTHNNLLKKMHSIFSHAVCRYYKDKARTLGYKKAFSGGLTVVQKFGDALNLNPHYHLLIAEGVFVLGNKNEIIFKNIAPPSSQELLKLIEKISNKMIKYLQKKNYLKKHIVDNEITAEEESELMANIDQNFTESNSLLTVTQASLTQKIAFDPNSGKNVRKIKIGHGFGNVGEKSQMIKPCTVSCHNFNLNAGVSIAAMNRQGLENLLSYMLRPPVSLTRLSQNSSGDLEYKLKKTWSDRTQKIIFSPLEFLEKLTALIPQPRAHGLFYFGVFASKSKLRSQILLLKKPKNLKTSLEQSCPKESKSTWAKYLAKVFKIDILKCPKCCGEMKIIAAITDHKTIDKILTHLGLGHSRAPPETAEVNKLSFEYHQYSDFTPESSE